DEGREDAIEQRQRHDGGEQPRAFTDLPLKA
ncbi:MAG: hypothetical protein ACI80F_002843, partial [Natronomonas sp.]